MNAMQSSFNNKRFFTGLGMFIFSAGTVAFVTDPYVMLDISLIMLSVYLMASSLMIRNEE